MIEDTENNFERKFETELKFELLTMFLINLNYVEAFILRVKQHILGKNYNKKIHFKIYQIRSLQCWKNYIFYVFEEHWVSQNYFLNFCLVINAGILKFRTPLLLHSSCFKLLHRILHIPTNTKTRSWPSILITLRHLQNWVNTWTSQISTDTTCKCPIQLKLLHFYFSYTT